MAIIGFMLFGVAFIQKKKQQRVNKAAAFQHRRRAAQLQS
jgi:hypothetical protein